MCNRQPPRFHQPLVVMLPNSSETRTVAADVRRRNPQWPSVRTASPRRPLHAFHCLVLLASFALVSARAQHIHVQAAFTQAAGWDLFWYDFESGAFPADVFAQPLPSAALGRIPDDSALTNALGPAGSPVWTLPQFEANGLPSLGLGAQGSAGALVGGSLQLRLATFSGPGHFALHSAGTFGETTVHIATKDGLSETDALGLIFPGGHVHANWSFTRPGEYQLGFQARGLAASTGQPTNSAVTVFRFRVAGLQPPVLQIEPLPASPGYRLRTLAEPRTPLRIDVSTNGVAWTAWTNLWTSGPEWTADVPGNAPIRFFRALHPIP